MTDPFSLAFKKLGQEKNYWQQDSKILLAVSGGVDSMVLLELMQRIQAAVGFSLGVAHVNHQLRKESLQEEKFLRSYCKRRQLPFYCTRWSHSKETGMEAAARSFRYQFFTEIMEAEEYDTLMTAHHLDDQGETVLMKLIRGGDLRGHLGILPEREFASGRLLRPLLSFSKKAIRKFAHEEQIKYFEDITNAQPLYQRNRIRLRILPELEKENPQAAEHLAQFSQQLAWAEELISQQTEVLYQQIVTKAEAQYQLDGQKLNELTEAQQYYFWDTFFQKTLAKHGVGSKQQQLERLLRLCKSQKSQWQLDFENHWVLVKEYQQLRFYREENAEPVCFAPQQIPTAGIYLNAEEWVAVFPSDSPCEIPFDVLKWRETRWDFTQPRTTEFFLRKREDGDRIQLSPTLRKRVSRYFIDEKIPESNRRKAWIICDEKNEILAILPYIKSYLSIAEETDTIQYTLIYKNKSGS